MELMKEIHDGATEVIAGSFTTVRDLKGITESEMEAVYSLGYNYYRTGNVENAEKVFKFLVLFDHLNPKFWMGLGAVRQVKGDLAGADAAYSYASFLDLSDPKPQFHAAECYLSMGDRESAASALESLERFAPTETERARFYRSKAAALKMQIKGASLIGNGGAS